MTALNPNEQSNELADAHPHGKDQQAGPPELIMENDLSGVRQVIGAFCVIFNIWFVMSTRDEKLARAHLTDQKGSKLCIRIISKLLYSHIPPICICICNIMDWHSAGMAPDHWGFILRPPLGSWLFSNCNSGREFLVRVRIYDAQFIP